MFMLIKGQPVCCLYEGIQDPSIFISHMSKSVVFLMLSFDFYKLSNFALSGYPEPDIRGASVLSSSTLLYFITNGVTQ